MDKQGFCEQPCQTRSRMQAFERRWDWRVWGSPVHSSDWLCAVVEGCHVRDHSSSSPLSSPTANTSLLLVLQPLLLWVRGAKAMLVTGAPICGSLATGVLDSSAWNTQPHQNPISHQWGSQWTLSCSLNRRAHDHCLSTCYTVVSHSVSRNIKACQQVGQHLGRHARLGLGPREPRS